VRYSVTTPEGDQIVLCFCAVQPGTDGKQRDARVGISAQPGASLTAQALATLLPHYLPPDTKHVRDFTDPQIGLIHVYTSADLAATFPASDFSDSGTGQALPPGTFGVACNQPGAPGPGCDVVLGD
jgi:hypothetical protein